MEIINQNNYKQLISEIEQTLKDGCNRAAVAINNQLVQTYWQIGKYIVEYEQKGNIRAEYGADLITHFSKDLTLLYGKGFNRNNIQYIRKLSQYFPNCTTLSCKLSWSHYIEILKTEEPLERNFYLKQCEIENWSVRELKRQRNSMLFQLLS